MVAGQLNNKIGFIIQARMKSDRLPGKVSLPLPFGGSITILEHVFSALRKSKIGGEIIVATSTDNSNVVIEDLCASNGIYCFRGDETDVLSRFLNIVGRSDYDHVVRLTADNPIIDVSVLDKTIEYHIQNQLDYTSTSGLPVGMNFEVIRASAFLELPIDKLTLIDKEHVTLYIRNNPGFQKGVFIPFDDVNLSHIRLTIDYVTDYLLISSLFSWAERRGSSVNLQLIMNLFEHFPWLITANSGNIQKMQFDSKEEELNAAAQFLRSIDMFYAASKLSVKR